MDPEYSNLIACSNRTCTGFATTIRADDRIAYCNRCTTYTMVKANGDSACVGGFLYYDENTCESEPLTVGAMQYIIGHMFEQAKDVEIKKLRKQVQSLQAQVALLANCVRPIVTNHYKINKQEEDKV